MEIKFIFFFALFVSLYHIVSCDIINVKNFREIVRYFFQIQATPLSSAYSFHVKRNILAGFQMCISVPLISWKKNENVCRLQR